MKDCQRVLIRHLDTNGDGTGTKDATGDYSSSATEFKIVPPADESYSIHRLTVVIEDGNNFEAELYGKGVELINGIAIKVKNGVVSVNDLTNGSPILNNSGWTHLCGANIQLIGWGGNEDQLIVDIVFTHLGIPLVLDGNDGEYLSIELNDNFSGLDGHYFVANGFIKRNIN